MSNTTGLIGFFGTFQISIIDDPRAKGGSGKRWLCSCRRGHPRANRGRKRKKGIRLPYPCNHLVQIWEYARRHKKVHPRFRLTRLGELAADECVCLRGAEPTPLDRVPDARGPAEPLQQQAASSLRNKPCPCESGLKWRECHGAKDEPGSPPPKAPRKPPKIPQDQPIPAHLFPLGLVPPDAPKAPPGRPAAPPPRPPPPPVPPPVAPPAPARPKRGEPLTDEQRQERAAHRRELAIEREVEKATHDRKMRPIMDAIHVIDERRREATRATRKARELEQAAGRRRSAEAKQQRAQAEALRAQAAELRAKANKKAATMRERSKAEHARQARAKAKAQTVKKGKAKK